MIVNDFKSHMARLTDVEKAGLMITYFRHDKYWWDRDRDRLNAIYEKEFGKSAILFENVEFADTGLAEDYYDQEENPCGTSYAFRSKNLDYGIDININELGDL